MSTCKLERPNFIKALGLIPYAILAFTCEAVENRVMAGTVAVIGLGYHILPSAISCKLFYVDLAVNCLFLILGNYWSEWQPCALYFSIAAVIMYTLNDSTEVVAGKTTMRIGGGNDWIHLFGVQLLLAYAIYMDDQAKREKKNSIQGGEIPDHTLKGNSAPVFEDAEVRIQKKAPMWDALNNGSFVPAIIDTRELKKVQQPALQLDRQKKVVRAMNNMGFREQPVVDLVTPEGGPIPQDSDLPPPAPTIQDRDHNPWGEYTINTGEDAGTTIDLKMPEPEIKL